MTITSEASTVRLITFSATLSHESFQYLVRYRVANICEKRGLYCTGSYDIGRCFFLLYNKARVTYLPLVQSRHISILFLLTSHMFFTRFLGGVENEYSYHIRGYGLRFKKSHGKTFVRPGCDLWFQRSTLSDL